MKVQLKKVFLALFGICVSFNLAYGAGGGFTDSSDNSYYGEKITDNSTTTASNADVMIEDGDSFYNVYGAYIYGTGGTGSDAGLTTGDLFSYLNNVSIYGGNISGNVYGGYAYNTSSATASGEKSARVFSNKVYIYDGSIGGNVYGGYGYSANSVVSVYATNNKVYIYGGSINNGNIYGGYADDNSSSGYSSYAESESNEVIISGGYIKGNVYGGYTHTQSKSGYSVSSSSNVVTISGGYIEGNVYGGYIYRMGSTSGTVDYNVVSISGGAIIRGDVYGGVFGCYLNPNESYEPGELCGSGGDDYSRSNMVTLSGATIYGSVYGGTGSTSDSTGNNLYVDGASYIGGDVESFSKITIKLKSDSTDGFSHYVSDVLNGNISDAFLQIGGSIGSGIAITMDASLLSSLNITNYTGSLSSLTGSGLDIKFINDSALNGHTITNNISNTIDSNIGSTIDAKLNLNGNANTLNVTLESAQAKSQAKVLNQSNLASLSLTAQGTDLLATQAITQAINSLSFYKETMLANMIKNKDSKDSKKASNKNENLEALVEDKKFVFVPFAVVQDAYNSYSDSANLSINGFHMVLGFAGGADMASKATSTSGGFFEYGYGLYDTELSGYNGVGSGYYVGGGVLEHVVMNINEVQKAYIEGSFRGGFISNTYTNSGLVDSNSLQAGFDGSSYYIGGHVGAGYIHHIAGFVIDGYAKYLITHQGAYDVTLSTGDPISFDSLTSHRIRLGAKTNYRLNKYFEPYGGIYYEVELGGIAKAKTYYDYDIQSVSLSGHTGVIEAGVSVLSPFKSLPLSINAIAQGYYGKRTGVNGVLSFRYGF